MLICVVGQGYVGLPLAMRAVEVGYRVVGYDVDTRRVKRLTIADSYVEDVASETITSALDTGRYVPTDEIEDCANFDVAVITVPTPLREGLPDLSYVEEAARSLGRYVKPGSCVILESTTYPGTTETVVAPILEATSGLRAGVEFALGYSPERIDPGNSRWGLVNTPKVVSGVNESSLVAVRRFYDSLVDTTIAVAGTREAEFAKLIENTFRHVNIGLMNELAMVAARLGVDVWEAIAAAASKPFGFMRFEPGPGVGGHCVPVDPRYLSWYVQSCTGVPFEFVELATAVNGKMPDYVVERLERALQRRGTDLAGSRILLAGLAYKADSGDIRESPAVAVAERLSKKGCEVRVADPHVELGAFPPFVVPVDLSPFELRAAGAVVLLTAHSIFDFDLLVSEAAFVLDTRGKLRGPNVERV